MYIKECRGNLAKKIQNMGNKIRLERQEMNKKQHTLCPEVEKVFFHVPQNLLKYKFLESA